MERQGGTKVHMAKTAPNLHLGYIVQFLASMMYNVQFALYQSNHVVHHVAKVHSVDLVKF